MLNRQEAMEAIDELTEYCRNCTPADAYYIEEHVRGMLVNLVPKSNLALGLKTKATIDLEK